MALPATLEMMRALSVLLALSSIACASTPTAERIRSAEGRLAPEPSLCDHYLELSLAEGRVQDEIEQRRSCTATSTQARARLSEPGIAKLDWCARHAQATASFEGCFESDWDADRFVAHRVSPPPPSFPAAKLEPNGPTPPSPPASVPEDAGETIERAKQLYAEADEYAQLAQWERAIELYEEAYELVPHLHGFAIQIGLAAFYLDDCSKAAVYLDHFVTHADPDKWTNKIEEAKQLLANISSSGCSDPGYGGPRRSDYD